MVFVVWWLCVIITGIGVDAAGWCVDVLIVDDDSMNNLFAFWIFNTCNGQKKLIKLKYYANT